MTMNRALVAVVGTLSIVACTSASEAQPPAKKLAKANGPRETAILAAGCFWGVEHWMMKADGVVDVEVGYVGGGSQKVSYEQVSSGDTGHAEAVRIVFDPARLSYADLLDQWFFRMHDPTTKNRQGNDIGASYRSAIFTTSDAQAKTAADVKQRVDASGRWKKPIVTEITPAGEWKPAEEDHQDYLQKHPDGYTCHYLRDDEI